PVSLQPPCLDRLPTEVEREELFTQPSLSRRLRETEAAHADTILELEKTRDMLILQHRINRDYQAELEGVMVQAEQEKRGHEEKQQKMVQLLDLRRTRIRQLEGKSRASPTCPRSNSCPCLTHNHCWRQNWAGWTFGWTCALIPCPKRLCPASCSEEELAPQ
ncbi:retinitis pigmentosa GTPase regulator interacting protein 1, partial [Chelydra serpentina]